VKLRQHATGLCTREYILSSKFWLQNVNEDSNCETLLWTGAVLMTSFSIVIRWFLPHVSSIGIHFRNKFMKIRFVSQEDIIFASVSCTILKNRHGQNTVVLSSKESVYILSHLVSVRIIKSTLYFGDALLTAVWNVKLSQQYVTRQKIYIKRNIQEHSWTIVAVERQ